ncbi:MAG: hypothetical protein AAGE98_12590, partial [Actinomycetota bacterium]
FHGPAEGENAEMKELTWAEGAVLMPFLAAIFFMGLYPSPVIERMEPAVDALIVHIEDNVEGFDEADADIGDDIKVSDLGKLGKEEAKEEGGEG